MHKLRFTSIFSIRSVFDEQFSAASRKFFKAQSMVISDVISAVVSMNCLAPAPVKDLLKPSLENGSCVIDEAHWIFRSLFDHSIVTAKCMTMLCMWRWRQFPDAMVSLLNFKHIVIFKDPAL